MSPETGSSREVLAVACEKSRRNGLFSQAALAAVLS